MSGYVNLICGCLFGFAIGVIAGAVLAVRIAQLMDDCYEDEDDKQKAKK